MRGPQERPFAELFGKFKTLGMDQRYLAEFFGMSQAGVSHLMTGESPWTLSRMYAVMDLIQEPYDQLHIYFPKDGGVAVNRQDTHVRSKTF